MNEAEAMGKRIIAARKALGLSQQQLGGHIGVTYQQIQKYEAGNDYIPVPRLKKAAQFLGVSVEQLVNGETPPPQVIDKVQVSIMREVSKLNKVQKKGVLDLVSNMTALQGRG